MKKHLSLLIISLIGSNFYTQLTIANLSDKCLLNVPIYNKSILNKDYDELSVYIQADKVTVNYPNHVLFSGNVDIKQNNSMITADEVHLSYHQDKNLGLFRTITATGNVNYFNNKIKVYGVKAWSNLYTKDTNIYNSNYKMVGRQGRGDANIIKQRDNNRYTILENGSFTSCIPSDNSWKIIGSKIIYDRKEQIVEIWNAYFKISEVPIFYSPYLQIPIGNKRRSGFLTPNVHYSDSNGFEFNTIFYFNLAPNYDATITHKYTSKLNTQIQTEFRYLTIQGSGLIEFDWLPKYQIYDSKHYYNERYRNRWLFYWNHKGVMNYLWRFNIDYTKVSDSNYFKDLNSKYGNSTDWYATQKFNFGYSNESYEFSLLYKQFQIFDIKNKDNTYNVTPQLDFHYYGNNNGPFNIKLFSQITKFTNINTNKQEAIRLHIEPALSMMLVNQWGNLNTEAKLLFTHYHQDNSNYYTDTNPSLKKSVNRILPQFKTSGKIILERNMDHWPNYMQFLESQLQYLYIPYRNQNSIGIYDSTILKTDYLSLFRNRIYSGFDYILPTNQLTSSIATRIYDQNHIERFNASIGQLYHLSQFNTNHITNIESHNYVNTSKIIWIGDSYWRINDQLIIHGGLQYDCHLRNIALGNAVLEYQRKKNYILQLNYRYACSQYIAQILSNIRYPVYQQDISQLGAIISWPLINSWSIVSTYYYDIKANQSANKLIGLQYNNCCWTMNVGYERRIIGWSNYNNSSQYDNRISFNIELRGLNNSDSMNTDKMLKSSTIPYHLAF